MRIVIFGATGMVGQGVLRECLLDADVDSVLAIGRAATGVTHPKLRDVNHSDFTDFTALRAELTGVDATFFCLGVSSVGMPEERYRRITYDFTLAAGRALAEHSPDSTFSYVSGAGTDSTEHGRTMWARVKGATENALLALPLRTYLFRPGFIQPMHGITSKTRLYRYAYVVTTPLFPLLNRVAPGYVTSTERIGRAMLLLAKHASTRKLWENRDINQLVAG